MWVEERRVARAEELGRRPHVDRDVAVEFRSAPEDGGTGLGTRDMTEDGHDR
jgi:hypothetical protein